MKPRLEAAPITDEDSDAWCEAVDVKIRHSRAGHFRVRDFYRNADRRDASIMLVLGWWRVKNFSRRWRFAAEAAEFPGLHAGGDSWWSYGRRDP